MFETEHPAGPPEPHLHIINDQKSAGFRAPVPQFLKESRYGKDDACLGLNCLGHYAGGFRCDLAEIPRMVEPQEPGPGNQRAEGVLEFFIAKDAQRPLGASVVGILKSKDSPPARVPLGQLDCAFDRFTAALDKIYGLKIC